MLILAVELSFPLCCVFSGLILNAFYLVRRHGVSAARIQRWIISCPSHGTFKRIGLSGWRLTLEVGSLSQKISHFKFSHGHVAESADHGRVGFVADDVELVIESFFKDVFAIGIYRIIFGILNRNSKTVKTAIKPFKP